MATPEANVHTIQHKVKESRFNHIINIYVCVHCRLWSSYFFDYLKYIVGLNCNVVRCPQCTLLFVVPVVGKDWKRFVLEMDSQSGSHRLVQEPQPSQNYYFVVDSAL